MLNKTSLFLNQKHLKHSYNFLVRLTNQTGIIQHTKYGLPDRKNGYSLDDNARAIVVTLEWNKNFKDKKSLDLAATYLAWLFHAKTDEGYFYNFSTFDNQFKETLSEDGFGRAFWALGFAHNAKARDDITFTAKNLIDEVKHNLNNVNSPRAIAYCILGLTFLIKSEPKNKEWRDFLLALSAKLTNYYKNNRAKDWYWFEKIVAYSNHLLPLSMIEAYSILKDEELLKIGLESLDFVEKNSWVDSVPAPIGNQGWLLKGGKRALFDQQPIEASEAILALLRAFEVTKNTSYLKKAWVWFSWYHGNNVKKVSLINKQTGGCFDSLTSQGVNENQGAESIIAYLMSALALLNKEKIIEKNLVLSS